MDTKDNKNKQQITDEELDKVSGGVNRVTSWDSSARERHDDITTLNSDDFRAGYKTGDSGFSALSGPPS